MGAAFFGTTPRATGRVPRAAFGATSFATGLCLAETSVEPPFLETAVVGCFATRFLAAPFMSVALAPALMPAAFPGCDRVAAALGPPRFFFAVVALAARVGAVFTRVTLTSPRMARADGRAFADAAFDVGRRVGLLRGVEAMGTALVTVAAGEKGQR
jgi:hypothetical protein